MNTCSTLSPPNLKAGLGAFFFACLSLSAAAQTLPPVVVTAQTIRNGVACYRQECAGAIESLSSAIEFGRRQMAMIQGVETPDPRELTSEEKCTAVRNSKPTGCGSAPPAINGIGGSVGNGCGAGWFSRTSGSALLSITHPIAYTGNIDAPIAGASFLNACNTHDACYAQQLARGACDATFNNNVNAACGTATDIATCLSMADKYAIAVTSSYGTDAYNASAAPYACYLYHKEMDANNCGSNR